MTTTPRAFSACLATLVLLGLGSISAADDAADCGPAQKELDWVPKSQLTPAQQAALPVGCDGTFVEPAADVAARVKPADSAADEEAEISISGKDSQSTRQSTVMSGDVILIQGDRKITGDNAELFNEPQGVHLDGHVSFREPGFLLRGDHAEINLEQNTLQVDNARYVLHTQRIHGEAGQIKRDEAGVIRLQDSTYSSCSPEDEVWYLKASSMMLDPQQGQGEASHVRLEVFDFPIFYFPWLRFPIGNDRHSGFLAPSFASSEDGIDIALPYYFNLAPNYDAVLVPRVIADRGAQIGGEFRHLSSLFKTTASAALLPDDRVTGDDRWLVNLKQNGGQKQPWSTLIEFTRVSDKDYFEDLDNIGLSVSRNTHLRQRGQATYTSDHWLSEIEIESFQTLRDSLTTDPYEKLPDLRTTGDYQLGNGFFTRLDQQITSFRHTDSAKVTGDRLAMDYSAGWRSDWQAGFIESTIYERYHRQELNNAPLDNSPEVSVPAASLDMGLYFVRHNEHYTQTLEPRVYYYYADYQNQDGFQLFDTDELHFSYDQLFRNYRFSGADRIGDANQTSLGITSNWLDNQTGKTALELGLGQIYYATDRRITAFDPATFSLLPVDVRDQYRESRSPVAASAQWWFHPLWHVASEIAWDEKTHNTQNGNIFLHYEGIKGELFSIGYRHATLLTQLNPNLLLLPAATTTFVSETNKQGDISVLWPVSNQWSVMGRDNYDFSHNRVLELLAGFQYEDCCWRLRTVYRQWTSDDNTPCENAWCEQYRLSLPEEYQTDHDQTNRGIFIEIQFKNLAGLGTKTNSMLEDSIYGYHGSN